jgi:hypothetical protein
MGEILLITGIFQWEIYMTDLQMVIDQTAYLFLIQHPYCFSTMIMMPLTFGESINQSLIL